MKTIKLGKLTPIKTHEVWHPRYSKYDVLVPAYKVAEHNRVRFTKSRSLEGQDFYFNGKSKWKTESNGKVDCVVVPLNKLQKLEIEERDLREVF